MDKRRKGNTSKHISFHYLTYIETKVDNIVRKSEGYLKKLKDLAKEMTNLKGLPKNVMLWKDNILIDLACKVARRRNIIHVNHCLKDANFRQIISQMHPLRISKLNYLNQVQKNEYEIMKSLYWEINPQLSLNLRNILPAKADGINWVLRSFEFDVENSLYLLPNIAKGIKYVSSFNLECTILDNFPNFLLVGIFKCLKVWSIGLKYVKINLINKHDYQLSQGNMEFIWNTINQLLYNLQILDIKCNWLTIKTPSNCVRSQNEITRSSRYNQRKTSNLKQLSLKLVPYDIISDFSLRIISKTFSWNFPYLHTLNVEIDSKLISLKDDGLLRVIIELCSCASNVKDFSFSTPRYNISDRTVIELCKLLRPMIFHLEILN